MTEKQKAKWAIIREKGRLRFILRHGILTAGLAFATLSLLFDYYGFFGSIDWRGFPVELYRFVFRALFFGLFMGWWVWYLAERRFHTDDSSEKR